MVPNWETLASMGTAGGTLVLAIATFASVRSANRAARTAERALLAGLRPLLVTSRLQDPAQKIMFGLVARPRKDDKPDEDVWLASVSLHHNVDRPDPREAPQGFDGPAG